MDDSSQDGAPAEQALVRRARGGDREAFGRLVRSHQDGLFRFLLGRTGNRPDAEDLCQETLVRAFRKLHRFDDERPLRPWLYTIAARILSNHRRKRWLEDVVLRWRVDAGEDSVTNEQAHPGAPVWIWQTAGAFLNRREFLILWLNYAEGLDHTEIAGELSMTPGAVKTAVHRARRKLKLALAREGEGGSVTSINGPAPAGVAKGAYSNE